MLTEKEVATFERNCVNIGYNMCKAEVFTVLLEIAKECQYSEQLNLLRTCKEKISKLECVWKRQED